jgi:hypothetical protein
VDIEHDFFNQSTSLLVTHGERGKDFFAATPTASHDYGADDEETRPAGGGKAGKKKEEDEGEVSLLPPLAPPAEDGVSSFAGAVFNLANSTIGAGALGTLPPSPLINLMLNKYIYLF